MAKHKRKIDEVFPILAIEKGLIISKNGDITVPYELSMPEIFTLSAADYDRMHHSFTRALESGEDNTVVHKQDWYLVEKYLPEYDKYPDSPSCLGRSDERHFAERPFISHRCLLFITRPMDPILKKKSSRSSLLSSSLVPRRMLDAAYLQKALQAADQFVKTLEESKLFKSNLSPKMLEDLKRQQFLLRMGIHCI